MWPQQHLHSDSVWLSVGVSNVCIYPITRSLTLGWNRNSHTKGKLTGIYAWGNVATFVSSFQGLKLLGTAKHNRSTDGYSPQWLITASPEILLSASPSSSWKAEYWARWALGMIQQGLSFAESLIFHLVPRSQHFIQLRVGEKKKIKEVLKSFQSHNIVDRTLFFCRQQLPDSSWASVSMDPFIVLLINWPHHAREGYLSIAWQAGKPYGILAFTWQGRWTVWSMMAGGGGMNHMCFWG